MGPDDVTKIVKDAGLRGRGGAGFSAGVKWSFLPKNHPGPVYMCINADESEPGTFNNRILMEDDPHQVLEGTMLSCYATRANCYICKPTGVDEVFEMAAQLVTYWFEQASLPRRMSVHAW